MENLHANILVAGKYKVCEVMFSVCLIVLKLFEAEVCVVLCLEHGRFCVVAVSDV
jgi:hypothetical protein